MKRESAHESLYGRATNVYERLMDNYTSLLEQHLNALRSHLGVAAGRQPNKEVVMGISMRSD